MPKIAVVLLAAMAVALTTTSIASAATIVVGTSGVRPDVDQNAAGSAEAFRTSATASGTVDSMTVYLNTTNKATKLYVGLYTDNNGHPGTLLTQGSKTSPAAGASNDVTVPGAAVVSGRTYWIAIMGTGGLLTFRDKAGGGKSETHAVGGLTAMPPTWQTGNAYTDGQLSAYGSDSGGTVQPPVLNVTPTSLSFSATTGGSDPATKTASVTNTGGGTLSFTTSTGSAAWLSATPASGSAPATVTVAPHISGLSAGTYDGAVTITATGATGSPATIAVHLTVADTPPPPDTSKDWLQVDRDPMRTGFASGETAIGPTEAKALTPAWATVLDGKVTAQPLYAGQVSAGGSTRNVIVAATSGASIYALDADSGAVIWRRNFGTPPSNCAIPGGYGFVAPPAIDKARNRIYTVSEDGVLRTLNLADGTDAATGVPIITNAATNRVWGGPTLIGSSTLYVSTASDGCDSPPWRGRVLKVDVSGATPSLTKQWDVVPGIAAPAGGGGIWGYGGVSVDPTTGRVYAATGADSVEAYTLYADRLVALSSNLDVLGSFEPFHPTNYPCNGDPCDVDFGATPVVFTPTGCPTMVSAGNKNGNLYVERASSLASSGTAEQAIQLNPANDWLGSGGVGGVPAWDATDQMLFVSDVGPGWGTTVGGVVGLKVNADCTLSVAWSKPLGGGANPDSTPTVANGVVYVGEGNTGKLAAFDAKTGASLWTSTGGGAAYAAPIVANGTVYQGIWNGFGSADKGTIKAFKPGAPPPPPLATTLLGDERVEGQTDQNASGTAEAFQATATAGGTLTQMSVYLDASSSAAKVTVGVYGDTGATKPGTLLTQGSSTTLTPGAWNTIAVPSTSLTAATKYWIAILGTGSGTMRFRDAAGGCQSEASASTTLTALPSTWSTGAKYTDCPLSGYGTAATA
ncbi:MAG TPA: PQQ-binding-like beta-propeller repeat protein [Baekduia sp.]|nr:PQQ-binding-like beta-propeller repeat protein [Baekduia sp.]